ncbi:hypothetical protein EDC01DRAFT_783885 [Geopyxis carbonaria]|nr:hypothetical protein EDC01DRAFT_783885 [Geopyxis carbonaria]
MSLTAPFRLCRYIRDSKINPRRRAGRKQSTSPSSPLAAPAPLGWDWDWHTQPRGEGARGRGGGLLEDRTTTTGKATSVHRALVPPAPQHPRHPGPRLCLSAWWRLALGVTGEGHGQGVRSWVRTCGSRCVGAVGEGRWWCWFEVQVVLGVGVEPHGEETCDVTPTHRSTTAPQHHRCLRTTRPHSTTQNSTTMSSGSAPALAAQTLAQDAHLRRNPTHADIAPSTAADKLSIHHTPLDDDDDDAASISSSILDHDALARPRHATLPDLRFEQSYLASIAGADGVWWRIALITVKDQVLFPLVQGMAYNLAMFGWRRWNRGAKMVGGGVGGAES